MRNFLLFILVFFISAHSSIAQSKPGIITAGVKLTEGQRIYSANESHYLIVQPDGNLCIYTSADAFVWCSMASKGSGSYLILQNDGNLVVYDRNNQASWSSQTQAFYDAKYGTSEWKPVRAVLENDGTLCLYTVANRKVWNSTAGKINTGGAATETKPIPTEGFTGPTTKRELNIVLPGARSAQNVQVEVTEDGRVFFQSDMFLGKVEDFNTPPKEDNSPLWPNSTIPYVIAAGHPEKDLILAGINEINSKTNLCLTPRTNQPDYVEFVAEQGNWSAVGRIKGPQKISIQVGGAVMATVAHEILHAAGFDHMQSREDRDNYVRINFGNITAGKEHNFERLKDKASNMGAYDFSSVMHYHAKAFTKNGQNTIDVKNGQTPASMGQRDGLSAGDIAAVASIYTPSPCKPATTGAVTSTKPAPTSSTCEAKDAVKKYQTTMKPGDRIVEKEKLVSANGRFQLRGTPNGDFVIEEIMNSNNCQFKEVFRFPLTGPIGNPPAVSFLSFNPDGNICIDSKQRKNYCATNGQDNLATTILGKVKNAELTDDGRLRLINNNGQEIWATSPPTNTNPISVANLAPFNKTKSFVLVNETFNKNETLTSDNNQYQCRITPQNRFVIEKITIGVENGQQVITERVEIWNKPYGADYITIKDGYMILDCFYNKPPAANLSRARFRLIEKWKLEDDGKIQLYSGGTSFVMCPVDGN